MELQGKKDITARKEFAVEYQEKKKGLVIVHTGEGKGKTTAALGLIMRAWGRDMHVGMLQFIKNYRARFGEIRAAEKMGIEIIPMGDGRVCNSTNIENSIILAVQAWVKAQECILSGEYDLLVLDEFTYPLMYDWINVEKVVTWLRENKPPMLHLVITGRNAPKELIDYADLVTEMQAIKHHYSSGIAAQRGVEF